MVDLECVDLPEFILLGLGIDTQPHLSRSAETRGSYLGSPALRL